MNLFNIRVTASCLKKAYLNDFPIITEYVKQQHPNALIVWEHEPKLHLHAVGHCSSLELEDLSKYLSERLTSRGFKCTFYDEDSLKQRTKDYYYGYLLKQDTKNIIHNGNMSSEYLDKCLQLYQTSKEDPASSFKDFIIRNHPQSFSEVHNLCLLWYRHNTSDFKYDNIKKKYCRALMYVFPDAFSAQLRTAYNHEKLIS